ncbi:hypothetical protein PanWU01x14_358990 [Parasponia andersonii]|uniref:Uncharacterized protein n=1 Tax=Parasponia andersonii TaxID=3476 RepID=A0A2P5A845_PARAD|nr:hypothetical protein PanWU01x14_358990 [Parasponia andersonii]
MAMVASFIRVALSDGEASEYGMLRSKKTITYRRPESEAEGFKARAAIEAEKKTIYMNKGFSTFALRNLRLQTTCRIDVDDYVVWCYELYRSSFETMSFPLLRATCTFLSAF